jgi:hypothetical protein
MRDGTASSFAPHGIPRSAKRRTASFFITIRRAAHAPAGVGGTTDSMDEQLRRTVVAWSLVARPDEHCVLWDLDKHVGVDQPWDIDRARVAAIQADFARLSS